MLIANADIGGAVVQRGFRSGDRYLLRGHKLTADEVRSIPTANRNALIEKGFLHIQLAQQAAPGERFVVPLGFGRYDVVEGKKLNDDGALSREAAYALAKIPMPKAEAKAPPVKAKRKEH